MKFVVALSTRKRLLRKLMLIWLFLPLLGKSQFSDCQLQSPVFTIHFGSGQIQDVNSVFLPTYRRVASYCPTDGHYTYTPSTSQCFRDDWHTIPEDHYPGNGGNMMLVNASYEGGAFLNTEIKGLKPNTTYEFGAWLMNLCKITEKCPFPLLPNIVIRLLTPDGNIASEFSVGNVARSKTPEWKQYRAYFVTPAAASTFTLLMINNSPGGCGNDFALDDITFRECVKKPPVKPVTKPPIAKKPQTPVKPSVKKPTPLPDRRPNTTTSIAPNEPKPVLRDTQTIRRKPAPFPAPPAILTKRTNPTVKQFETDAGEIKLDLYDNGEVDGDTISIFHNNSLVVAHARLSQKPITIRLTINQSNPHHEIVMVAENLGSIPPNTSLMIVTAGSKRYQVFISSTEQKNGKVVFDLKE